MAGLTPKGVARELGNIPAAVEIVKRTASPALIRV
jgi:hypothetical protein